MKTTRTCVDCGEPFDAGAIALCHPDRHPAERAAQANAVTAHLIDLRRELAAA